MTDSPRSNQSFSQEELSALRLKLLKVLQKKGYQPQSLGRIHKDLRLAPRWMEPLKQILSELVEEGVAQVRGRKILAITSSPSPKELTRPGKPRPPGKGSKKTPGGAQSLEFPGVVRGILRKHPRGFGFVAPQGVPSIQEVFIPKAAVGSAMDGDLVEITIHFDSISDPRGPEGEVIAVVERSRQYLIGVMVEAGVAWIRGLGEGRGYVNVVPGSEAKVGDRVRLEIVEWPDEQQRKAGSARVLVILGSMDDPSCDVNIAIEEFQLTTTFPEAVVEEAKKWGVRVASRDLLGREDLREVECFTIDPTTAKDFDDALSLIYTKKGTYQLGVHIADVAHYVRSGSELDREARKRCNSVYFPGRVVPMLPHDLSDNLCSLKPLVNRLTVSVFMEFDATGEMLRYRIARSVIRSAKRFSYEEALGVLEGKKKSPHSPTLHMMEKLCHLLKAHRAARGSVELVLPDVRVCVDDQGNPTGIETHDYDITHQMVEEFMLKANEVVAVHLTRLGRPIAYRIHEAPSPDDFQEFVATARALGLQIPSRPTNADIQKLFLQAKDSPLGRQLSVSFIKSMKLAYYSPDNIGHYGLGLDHYCHFTSPIRRYPDLIAQRALFSETEPSLASMTEACSEQERRAAKAESQVAYLKKLRLLDRIWKEDPQRVFPAVITRVKPNGISFELEELMIEGFLHVRELGDDYYYFDSRKMSFCGRSSGETFQYGNPISVHVGQVNLMTETVEWSMVRSKTSKKKGSE